MNILLLGGTGFIGCQMVEKLVNKGYSVSLIIHKSIPENFIETNDKIMLFEGDILDRNSIKDAFCNQDIVVNLVGQICDNKNLFYDLNIAGPLNVLELCKDNGINNLIHVSTSLVYGESGKLPANESDPTDPKTNYSLTKLVAEKIYTYFAETYDLNLTILRLSNVYGPEKRVGIIYNIIHAIKNDDEIIMYKEGKQLRDFIYIDDVVGAILKVIEKIPEGVEIFNISSSTKVNPLQLTSIIENILYKKAKIIFAPDDSYNERCSWADNTKIKRLYKISPKVDLEIGIKKAIAYMEKVN